MASPIRAESSPIWRHRALCIMDYYVPIECIFTDTAVLPKRTKALKMRGIRKMTNEATNMPGPRSPWAGKAVQFADIEQELSILWKISADNMRTGQNSGVRTSVLNLVICAPDIESAERASKLLRALASTHLARVAVVILDEAIPAASVSAWITLRCFSMFSDLMRHCFEQVTLITTGAASRSIARIMQPLIKPDLPTYLWWLGDPPADSAASFKSLVEISNR